MSTDVMGTYNLLSGAALPICTRLFAVGGVSMPCLPRSEPFSCGYKFSAFFSARDVFGYTQFRFSIHDVSDLTIRKTLIPVGRLIR
jgi:hypothetical protein